MDTVNKECKSDMLKISTWKLDKVSYIYKTGQMLYLLRVLEM